MSYRRAEEWESRLKVLLDKIDDILEDQYGSEYRLHPARPPRNTTANKAYDGLFNIKASFSAGYGSKIGRGYVLDIHLSTLDKIEETKRETIRAYVLTLLNEGLPEVFPQHKVVASLENNFIKIHGDLNLGKL